MILFFKKKRNMILSISMIILLSLQSGFPVLAAALPETVTVSSFDPLEPEIASIKLEKKLPLEELTAQLPTTLTATVEKDQSKVSIPVTWSCSDDYTATDFDEYLFTAVWDENTYILSAADPSVTAPEITVTINKITAEILFSNLERAKSELQTLAAGKSILALVYLCDTYDLKKEASADAETAIQISAGQTVQIIAADEDPSGNIWYKVSVGLGESTYEGFIERKYLAYSDEDFINFEKKNINIYKMRTAAAAFYTTEDIQTFPASYQSALTELKKLHPNWIFGKLETGIDWSTAVKSQTLESRSLVPASSIDSWKNGVFDSNWSLASEGIIAHYLDPRNFLNDTSIFQFELLTYNQSYHQESAVQNILSSTFMSGMIPEDSRTYASAFYSIGNLLKVSPFHLACRVYQEQGKDGKSPLISGSYTGYNGLYNFFNVGATGKGSAEVIKNGLEMARKMGWTTRYLSLQGGATQISKNYIAKGQDTLYLQKFNVDPKAENPAYTHQYMQNIMAPASEASTIKKAYEGTGALNNPFVFKIPVYKNMPASACPKPVKGDSVTLDQTILTLKTGNTAVLKPSVNGTPAAPSAVTFTSSNPAVVTVDANGSVTAVGVGTASVSCTKSGGSTAVCQITVTKAVPSFTLPSLGSITYAPGTTLASIALPAGFTWDNPRTVPVPNVTKYPATFTPADTASYDSVKVEIPLTVKKAKPAAQAPAGLKGGTGNALSTVRLPAGWVWDTPDVPLSKEGSMKFTASYNPNAAYYDTVTGIEITITVVPVSQLCTTHTFGEWTQTTAPSCTAAGAAARTCTTCGQIEEKTVPAAGHSYSNTVTKEPTEEQTGIRTYTCSKCNDTYTEVIAVLPHTHKYSSKITKEASCTAAGEKTNTCICGAVTTETIPALGHSMQNGTCTRCGYKEITATPPAADPPVTPPAADPPATPPAADPPADTGQSDNTVKPSQNGQGDSTVKPSQNGQGDSTIKPSQSGQNGQSGSTGKTPDAAGDTAAEKGSPTVNMDMKNNTVLYEEALSDIRGNDTDLVLNMGHNLSWVINGKNIIGDDANGIDMGIQVNQGTIPKTLLESLANGSYYIELNLAHEGPLDFLPSLTLNTAPGNGGCFGNLFYYNPETEQLEFVTASEIDQDGNVTFLFDHASTYAIIITEKAFTAESSNAAMSDSETDDSDVVAAEAGNMDMGEVTNTKPPTKPLTVILVIVVLAVSIGTGVLIFLFFKKKEEAFGEEADDPADTVSTEETGIRGKTESIDRPECPEDEFDENGSDTFIDDYHEPELNTRPKGKIGRCAAESAEVPEPQAAILVKQAASDKSVSKKNGAESEIPITEDEFDGFE